MSFRKLSPGECFDEGRPLGSAIEPAPNRPRLTVQFPYDPEDDAKRSATSQTFFAAWVNQFGETEWTCTDEIDGPTDLAPLVEIMEREP